MPQPPGRVELQAAAILLGVDHEHPTGADHQVVDVGPAARDGQVVQDRPPVPLQRSQAAGRCAAPPPPRAARRRRLGWAGTAAPSRPPRPPARRRPVPAGAPAGCQGLPQRHRSQEWRLPARAGSGSRRPTRPPGSAATWPGRSRLAGPRWPAPAPPPPADRRRCRPATRRGRRSRWARMAWRSAWLRG